MSLREAGKQKRRDAILGAAEALIRRNGGIGFSMRDLAKEAGVAFVTPFNLFDNKGGVLAALFEARLETQRRTLQRDARETSDPVERMLHLAVTSARAYSTDPDLYRPLLRALPAVAPSDDLRLLDLAIGLWRTVLESARGDGMLAAERNLELLARTLHVGFRGTLSLWAADDIDAAELEHQAEYGVALTLAAILARPRDRQRLNARIAELEQPVFRRRPKRRGRTAPVPDPSSA